METSQQGSPQKETSLNVILNKLSVTVNNAHEISEWFHEKIYRIKKYPQDPPLDGSGAGPQPTTIVTDPDIISRFDILIDDLNKINTRNSKLLNHFNEIV
jgi:hypothetical protein